MSNYFSLATQDKTTASWQARLQLGFERRGLATVLARREHCGPLRVQKALYPEGEKVCHAIVLHPPSGIAGGDCLQIEIDVGEQSHALLTTPGAGKWYRSAGPWATQALHFNVAAGACMEWLPQENIVFKGAHAQMHNRVTLAKEAHYIGWDILCLGRRACRECFDAGELRLTTRIERAGKLLWLERGALAGNSALLHAPIGLAAYSVSATLLAVSEKIHADLLAACRQLAVPEAGAQHGITVLPHMLVARYLGHSAEAAREWFTALWRLLRPALIGREAQAPRIWNT